MITDRPWGTFEVLREQNNYKVKVIAKLEEVFKIQTSDKKGLVVFFKYVFWIPKCIFGPPQLHIWYPQRHF